MQLSGHGGSGLLRYPSVATMLGGGLWVPYGVFEMLQPWGVDTVYRDDKGYEVVTDALLYWVYSLPGSLALMLTTLALLGVFAWLRPRGRAGPDAINDRVDQRAGREVLPRTPPWCPERSFPATPRRCRP